VALDGKPITGLRIATKLTHAASVAHRQDDRELQALAAAAAIPGSLARTFADDSPALSCPERCCKEASFQP
jgi:hypothetical protein